MNLSKRLLANFRYFAPTVKNHLVYLSWLVAFLMFMEWRGDQAWQWFMDRMTLGQFLLFVGFGFYFVLFWLLGAGYLYLYYKRRPAWLYKYKIQDHGEGEGHRVPLGKAVGVVLFNQFFGTLPYLAGVYFFMIWMGYDAGMAAPPWYIMLFHIVAMILLQDLFFFLNHWFMHRNKFLYRHVHSIHHQYRESLAIATHYVHWVEHIIGNLFPVFIGAMILLPHPFVILFWILLIVVNALHNHSGFAFPYLSYSVHHDWHHYYVNSSYSSIGLMDKVFGTDKPFEEMVRMKSQ